MHPVLFPSLRFIQARFGWTPGNASISRSLQSGFIGAQDNDATCNQDYEKAIIPRYPKWEIPTSTLDIRYRVMFFARFGGFWTSLSTVWFLWVSNRAKPVQWSSNEGTEFPVLKCLYVLANIRTVYLWKWSSWKALESRCRCTHNRMGHSTSDTHDLAQQSPANVGI